jgi:hypothetical protein
MDEAEMKEMDKHEPNEDVNRETLKDQSSKHTLNCISRQNI